VGWTKIFGQDLVDDTTNFLSGTQSIRVPAANNVATFAGRTISAIDVSDLTTLVYFRYYIDDSTKLYATAPVSVTLSSTTDYTKYYIYQVTAATITTGWNTFCMPITAMTATNGPDPTNIIRLRVKIRALDGQSINLTADYLDVITNSLEKGIVQLTFDDGYSSVYDIAKPAMDAYGFTGLSAPIVANLSTGAAGTMTLGQMHDLKRAGWDIGNHGWAHPADPYYASYTEAQVDADVRRAWDYLVDVGLDPVDYFVYPGGYYDETVLAAVKRYHSYARRTGAYTYDKPQRFFAKQLAMPCFKPSGTTGVYPAGYTTLATAQGVVDAAETGKFLLPICFHRFEAESTADTYWNTQDFIDLMAYLDTKVQAGTLEVLNCTQTLARMRGEAVAG
jgi:peptidoglycan/xylan/chitin deacetylase (PgdA/CDA1 family)